jgi:ABC-type spermidine/putrescine transport system permease subunit II
LKAEEFLTGLIATVLGVLAFGILVRFSWGLWDRLMEELIARGYSPNIEYALGFLVVVVAVWLGIVELKKVRRHG